MGCDIHFYVEVRKGGVWKSVDKWDTDEDGWMHVPYGDAFYDDRNYDLFAILADVRNGVGFAGVTTGEGFNIIAPPRGLPSDVSPEVLKASSCWGCDGHSHSWFTLAELEAFDWKQGTRHQGVVDPAEFKTYIQKGHPDSWFGDIWGRDVIKLGITDMMALLKGAYPVQEGKSYCTTVFLDGDVCRFCGQFPYGNFAEDGGSY